MSGTHLNLTRLVFGVVPLVFVFFCSAFIVPGVAARSNACTFQLFSSATFPLNGPPGGPFGTVTLSKYLDGCGNEQGVLSANTPYTIVAGGVQIVGFTPVDGASWLLTTPVTFVGSGNGPRVCGGIEVSGSFSNAGGGGCTPN